MKKVQLDRYSMALGIENYLQKNADLFAWNVPMVASAEILSAKIAELEPLITIQLRNYTGATLDKKDIRKELENQAFTLVAACCSYATATGNAQFFDECYHTKSDFVHYRDMEFEGVCVQLLQIVTTNASELVPYNISQAMIANFQKAMSDFLTVMFKPMDAIRQKAAATAQIQLLLTEIMETVRVRLDMAMVSMIPTQPKFVGVYKNLKKIKNTGSHKRSLTVVVRDSETLTPISEVFLETDNNIKRKTGQKGISYVAHLPEGKHQLKISYPGYDSQSLKFFVISRDATKVEVLLKAAGSRL